MTSNGQNVTFIKTPSGLKAYSTERCPETSEMFYNFLLLVCANASASSLCDGTLQKGLWNNLFNFM